MRLLYLLLIAVTNVLTAKYDPITLWGGVLIIPVGSLLAGAVFVLRDLVQAKHGRRKTYGAILWATCLSVVLSRALGDPPAVAVASLVAFIASETLDTEIFTRLRKSFVARVLMSGVAGGLLDSIIFVMLGLSPIGGNLLPWELVPFAVLGQLAAKTLVQIISAGGLILTRRKWRSYETTTR
jgi:uncharacterized PurR-regulated membrane protein YhhQ (DUF165 family)